MNLANFYSWILFRIDNKLKEIKKLNQVNLFKYLLFWMPRIVLEVVVVACSAIMISQEIE